MNHRTDSATRHDLVTTRGAPRVRRRITHEVTKVGVGPKVGWASCARNTLANLRASFEGMVDPLLTTRCPLYIRKRTYAVQQPTSALPPTATAKADIERFTAYSRTVSARVTNDFGNVIPSALAAFRLTANSNRVGRSIGKSVGRAPLRILSMYPATRRISSLVLGP